MSTSHPSVAGAVGSAHTHTVDSAPDLSVVIPVKDEKESLPILIPRINEIVTGMGLSLEIIVIDDGSTDGSLACLETLAHTHPELQVIAFRRCFGKSAALAAGFERTRGNMVLIMDADLQDDPAEIPRFVEALKTSRHGMIGGWRYPRHDPLHKIIPSRIYNFSVNRVTGAGLHDMNCGFKIFRAEVVKEIQLYGELHRYIPILVTARGFTCGEIKITHHRRKHGRSKYGAERYLRGALDLVTVQFLTGYSHRPLHLIGAMGFLLFGLGFAIELYLAIGWFQGVEIQGRPLFFLGIVMMLIGVQTLLTGLLAALQIHLTMRPATQYGIAKIITPPAPPPPPTKSAPDTTDTSTTDTSTTTTASDTTATKPEPAGAPEAGAAR